MAVSFKKMRAKLPYKQKKTKHNSTHKPPAQAAPVRTITPGKPFQPMPSCKEITKPEHGVQVQVREGGRVLWVNVDGVCILRICQIPYMEIETSKDKAIIRPEVLSEKDNRPERS